MNTKIAKHLRGAVETERDKVCKQNIELVDIVDNCQESEKLFDQIGPDYCNICGAFDFQQKDIWCHMKEVHPSQPTNFPIFVDTPNDNFLTEWITCSECDKSFLCKQKLDSAHKNPGNCSICGLFFQSNKLIRRHMKEVHREGSRPRCIKCGLSYKSQN